MLVTEELTYKLFKEIKTKTLQECVKALSNHATYTDALMSLVDNKNDISKIRKGSIVVVISKTGNINPFKEGTITKVLSPKSTKELLLDQYYSEEKEDVILTNFENTKVLLLEDIYKLIHNGRRPFLKYNNRPCAFEFILNVRLANEKEKKQYHKLIKQIKY